MKAPDGTDQQDVCDDQHLHHNHCTAIYTEAVRCGLHCSGTPCKNSHQNTHVEKPLPKLVMLTVKLPETPSYPTWMLCTKLTGLLMPARPLREYIASCQLYNSSSFVKERRYRFRRLVSMTKQCVRVSARSMLVISRSLIAIPTLARWKRRVSHSRSNIGLIKNRSRTRDL